MRTIIAMLAIASFSFAQDTARIATYNIKFLNSEVSETRKAKIREVIDLLDADVIGLQEIADRAALEAVFDPVAWHLIIDEDSGSSQDVAMAVRIDWLLPQFPDGDLDADDEHFLFPGSQFNSPFPNRRDVLAVDIVEPNTEVKFTVMVIHAKARVGGRAVTDPRREKASRRLVEKLKSDYDGLNYFVLGDFNDNPDDSSLNILETGFSQAPGGVENIPGPFLINLTEPLLLLDHVSHGLKSDAVDGDLLNPVTLGSRAQNNQLRGTNVMGGDILFDQILIPMNIQSWHIAGSTTIFEHGVAAVGNNSTRASDHVPVYADFVLPMSEEDPGLGMRIAALLPNPAGRDAGNETVTIHNGSSQVVDLSGWKVVDAAGHELALSGSLTPGESTTRTFPNAVLNNNGDHVRLMDGNSVIDDVVYTGADATSGSELVY